MKIRLPADDYWAQRYPEACELDAPMLNANVNGHVHAVELDTSLLTLEDRELVESSIGGWGEPINQPNRAQK